RFGGRVLLAVVEKEGFGHENQFLPPETFLHGRRGDPVGNPVVDPRCSHATGKTNVSKLDGCGPKCCNARTAVFGVSTEIDQHFDVLGVDDSGSVEVADVAQIDESVCADLDLFPDLGAVVRPYA